MLRTFEQTKGSSQITRLIGILVGTLVTIIAARIVIPMDPVPFTLQPLAVLLAAMVLGARDGMLSQLLYVAIIALGLPVDANMRGSAAFFGATGGYLIGFVVAAYVVGWLTERGAKAVWLRWIAGIIGILIIYAFGIPVLMGRTGMDVGAAWAAGGAAFIVPDLIKALIAALLAEGGQAALQRYLPAHL
jgi:biotin transport system substrate-specific component